MILKIRIGKNENVVREDLRLNMLVVTELRI